MSTQAQTQRETPKGRGRRSRLVQKPPLEKEILALIAGVDKHLPAKGRSNNHYVVAAQKVVKEHCGDEEVGTGLVLLILKLRMLRDGEDLAARGSWPRGIEGEAAQFFSQYPTATIH